MAKYQKSVTFSNAMIDMDDGTITEYDKDGDILGVYSIGDVMKMWDGVSGVTLAIRVSDCMDVTGEAEGAEV